MDMARLLYLEQTTEQTVSIPFWYIYNQQSDMSVCGIDFGNLSLLIGQTSKGTARKTPLYLSHVLTTPPPQ